MTENNIRAVVNFTFDDITKDVNYDKIFLFVLSYEYNLNFNQIMTLFNFSSDIFWTYINTFRPMIKLGDRKAAMLKHSARKIYFKWLGSKVELTDKECEYYNYLSTYINDSFTNGDVCIHSSMITEFPLIARGMFVEYKTGRQLKEVVINSQEELCKYIDNIDTIVLNGEVFSKTSRVEFLIEKYYGDLNPRELRRKTVREIRDMMDKEAIEIYSQELTEKSIALVQHRMELVHRNG
jgi:hypothetical protein